MNVSQLAGFLVTYINIKAIEIILNIYTERYNDKKAVYSRRIFQILVPRLSLKLKVRSTPEWSIIKNQDSPSLRLPTSDFRLPTSWRRVDWILLILVRLENNILNKPDTKARFTGKLRHNWIKLIKKKMTTKLN